MGKFSKVSVYSCMIWMLHTLRHWHSCSGVVKWCFLNLCSAQPIWAHEACTKELLLLIQKLKLEALSSCRIAFLIPISLCLHPKEEKKMKSNKTLRENLSLRLDFLLLEIHPVYTQLNRMTFDWSDWERKWQDTSGFRLSYSVYCLVQQPLKLNEHIQKIHHNAICGVLLQGDITVTSLPTVERWRWTWYSAEQHISCESEIFFPHIFTEIRNLVIGFVKVPCEVIICNTFSRILS